MSPLGAKEAKELERSGIDAEFIDLRTPWPWDQDCVFESVRPARSKLFSHKPK
jgi:pyruvate/2-oxoglutarate/acetoin dehydrogenase E1 component